MADYICLFSGGGKADWDFFCVGGFVESEVEINPLKCKIKAIDEVCIKKETFHIISWHCKEYNPQVEIHLSESSYGIFAYQETISIHAQFFYNHSRFRQSKLRWEKRQDYYNSVKLGICKQTN